MIKNITPKQSKQINKLISKTCCNYHCGNCLLLDDGDEHRCVQQISVTGIYCKYFEKAVLPADEQLYAEIFKDTNNRKCQICGQEFIPKANNQKYCKSCAKIAVRRRDVLRKRK